MAVDIKYNPSDFFIAYFDRYRLILHDLASLTDVKYREVY